MQISSVCIVCVCVAFLLALCVRNPIIHTLLHAFKQIHFSLVFTFHRWPRRFFSQFSTCACAVCMCLCMATIEPLVFCHSLQIQLFGFSLFFLQDFYLSETTTKPLFDACQYCIVCQTIEDFTFQPSNCCCCSQRNRNKTPIISVKREKRIKERQSERERESKESRMNKSAFEADTEKKSSIGKTFPPNNEMFDYFDTVTHILSIGFYAFIFPLTSRTMDLFDDFVVAALYGCCCCYYYYCYILSCLIYLVPFRSRNHCDVNKCDSNISLLSTLALVIWTDCRITSNHHNTQIHIQSDTRACIKKYNFLL